MAGDESGPSALLPSPSSALIRASATSSEAVPQPPASLGGHARLEVLDVAGSHSGVEAPHAPETAGERNLPSGAKACRRPAAVRGPDAVTRPGRAGAPRARAAWLAGDGVPRRRAHAPGSRPCPRARARPRRCAAWPPLRRVTPRPRTPRRARARAGNGNRTETPPPRPRPPCGKTRTDPGAVCALGKPAGSRCPWSSRRRRRARRSGRRVRRALGSTPLDRSATRFVRCARRDGRAGRFRTWRRVRRRAHVCARA